MLNLFTLLVIAFSSFLAGVALATPDKRVSMVCAVLDVVITLVYFIVFRILRKKYPYI